MPYNRFICPDNQTILIKDCLEKGCRLYQEFEAGRCLLPSVLAAISEQREFDGTFSTTTLLNGCRENWLKIKRNYAIDPQQRIFALFGTRIHDKLEKFKPEGTLAEIRLKDNELINGQFDLYDENLKILYDYKTYGSYKAAKILGLYKTRVPMYDENGYPVLYKTGKNKGEPRYKDEWHNGGRKDRLDVAIQLNHYRLMLEAIEKQVKGIYVQVIVRDGGTYIATSRGIKEQAFLVKINKISDFWVKKFMNRKANELQHYLDTNKMPPPCKPRETWGGKRVKNADGSYTFTPGLKCEKYCDVWLHCDLGKQARNAAKFKPPSEAGA